MKTPKVYRLAYPALAVMLLALLPACTLLRWGGPPETKPVPESQAEDMFRQGEDLLAKGRYDQAREKYAAVKEKDPEKAYDALVQVRLGDSYYEEARYSEAEVEYRRFLDMHAKNKAAPYVVYQMGMCNFKQMDRPDRDPSFAANAAEQFQRLLKDYPNNPYEEEAAAKLKMARGRVAEHEYVVGYFYYKRGSYSAAINRFKGILKDYPGGKDEAEVLYYLTDSYIRLKDYDSAKSALAVMYQEYPVNRFTEKARKKLAGKIPAK